MLSFFRRLTKSKLGGVVAFLILGVIAVAFAAGDVTGLQSGNSGGVTGSDVARVGGTGIGTAELKDAATREVEALRQQQPALDIAGYVARGGVEGALERLVTSLALQRFGEGQGMAVSRRYVDGQIASIPALQGPTGKFDQSLYQRVLSERRLTDAQVRGDIARDTLAQQLTIPTIGASQMPAQLALPYASLLLERRLGLVGFVPNAAVPGGPAPTAAELTAFYSRNLPRYTLPQRRIVRYARVAPDQVRAQAVPTEAEVAAAYAADRARYAATQKRDIVQVVLPDQAAATALAARVRVGAGLAEAARAAGLEASTQTGAEKAGYTALTSPALADAAFSAAQGAVVGPLRTPLGWTVARIERIQQVAGRTLAEARGEIVTALARRKTAEALARIHDAVDDAIGENATFDEMIADRKLVAQATGPVTAAGLDPTAPGTRADPALAQIVAAAFVAEEGDAPQIVPTGEDGSFAVVGVGRVLPAAPRPLAGIRDQVARDFATDRTRQAARRVAATALAKANRGMPLPRALGETGLRLPAPRPLSVPRSQLAANPRGAEPTLALLFSMAPGSTKLLEAPNRAGWLLIHLDRIERGDAARQPGVISAARGDLARLVGREYAEQFARAARAAVGVKRDDAAVARVRAELTGQPVGR